MAETRYGLPLDYIDGETPYVASTIKRQAGVTDQIGGALSAHQFGVYGTDSFEVASGAGLSVDISAGEGIASSSDYGAVYLRSTVQVACSVPASSTGYIFAVIEESVDPEGNRSVETKIPTFGFSESNIMSGGIVLAYVVSSGSAVTAVYDRRRIINAEGDLFGGMFAQDDANTEGLVVGFFGGRLTKADGSLVTVNDFTVTVASGNNWVDIDEDGTAYVRTSSTPVGGHKCIWFAVANSTQVVTATYQRDKRSALDFGGGGSVVDASESVKGIAKLSAAPASPTNPIAVGDNDSRMTNARTPTGGAGGVLGGTYPNPSFAVNMAEQSELDAHTAAAAPHTGHLNIDGSNALSADMDAGGFAVQNLALGTGPNRAVIGSELDGFLGGYKDLENVKASSGANLTISGEQTLDAVACVDADRVLLTGQTTESENGPWVVRAGAWTRPADFDTGDTPDGGTRIFVQFGAARKGTSWTLITTGAEIDADPLLWTQTGAPGLGEANTASNTGTGTGLLFKAKSGVNLVFKSLKTASARLGITNNADDVTIDVVEAEIDRNALGGDPTTVANGGTGLGTIPKGSILYASDDDELALLAPDSDGVQRFISQIDDNAPTRELVTAPGYNATTDASLTSATGSFSFTTQAGTAFITGDWVRLIPPSAPSQWVEGRITDYVGTSMTVNKMRSSVPVGNPVVGWSGGFSISLAGQPDAVPEQNANTFYMGPDSGDPDVPTFRAPVTADFPNDIITFPKMRNIATDTLVGRASASSGDMEEIPCTQAGRDLLADADATAQRATLGLDQVDNTSDVDKPISDDVQDALDLKAPLADPALTGTPTVPTAAPGTNTTQAASTAFVKAAVDTAVTGLWDDKGGMDCSGSPNYPAASKGDAYTVTVAGKIGGGSGTTVDVGDLFVANADNAGGTEASVGTSWNHYEHNLVGAMLKSTYDAANDGKIDLAAGGTGADLSATGGANQLVRQNSSGGAFTVSALASADIPANAVNYSQMQDVSATDKILGRSSSGAGDVEEISCTSYARTLLDDADAATMRTTLGLGTIATQANPTGSVVGTTGSQTLTNKRITKRAPTVTQSATPAINTDTTEVAHIVGLAQNITSMTTNLTGTPVQGDELRIDITDDGTPRTIAWGSSFEAGNLPLPTTTEANARLDTRWHWNTATSKWRLVGTRLGLGTPDGTKFLRDDNTWATPSGGGGAAASPAGDLFLFNNAI